MRLVNHSTGQESPQKLLTHYAPINDTVLLPNGYLVSCSKDNTIKVWNIESGECLKTIYTPSGYVSNMAFIKNSNFLATLNDKLIK
jgi:WD40 repeat protein